MQVALTHDRSILDGATAEGILMLYRRVLDTVLTAGDTVRCLDVDVLDAAARAAVRDAGTGAPGRTSTVLEQFDNQIRRTPAAIALQDNTSRLSYRDIDDRSAALAGALAAAGVRHGDTVAVATGRTATMAVALLAVLRCRSRLSARRPRIPARAHRLHAR